LIMPKRTPVLCLYRTPQSPTHTTPRLLRYILDIVITKKLSIPVYLTSCSAVSSNHLAVLIDNSCRSSFQHPPDRHDFNHTDCSKYPNHLKDLIPFDPELHNGMAIDTYVEKFSGAVMKALSASKLNRRLPDDPGLRYRLVFRMR